MDVPFPRAASSPRMSCAARGVSARELPAGGGGRVLPKPAQRYVSQLPGEAKAAARAFFIFHISMERSAAAPSSAMVSL